MQLKVITLAVPALAVLCWAQTSDLEGQSQSQTQQEESTTGSQSGTYSGTQSGTTSEEQRPVRQARTSREKSRTYRGTLVDATCAQNMAQGGTMSGRMPSAERSTSTESTSSQSSSTESSTGAERSASESTGRESGRHHGEEHPSRSGAERSQEGMTTASGMARVDARAITQSCPVRSSTTDFALVTNDGRMYRFNEEGDVKAASELKTNNKWSKAVNDNKKISAQVRGSIEGETLQVESIK